MLRSPVLSATTTRRNSLDIQREAQEASSTPSSSTSTGKIASSNELNDEKAAVTVTENDGDQQAALEAQVSLRLSRRGRLYNWLTEAIDTRWSFFFLCFVTFSSGMVDVGMYTNHRTYANVQTGNLVIMFVALANPEVKRVPFLEASVSLATFLVTGFIVAQFTQRLIPNGPRTRWWMMLSGILQAIPTFVAAGELLADRWRIDPTITGGGRDGWKVVCCLSIQAGLQLAMARTIGCPEAPTSVLTISLIELVGDTTLFVPALTSSAVLKKTGDEALAKRVGMRNRRLIYIFSMILGFIVAATMNREVDYEHLLLCVAALRLVVTASAAFVR